MTTRKDLVIAEATQTHHCTETRRRKTWKTNNGTKAEVLIRTETSEDNAGDNRRVIEITTPGEDYRYRSHEGEEVTDDILQERDDEIKARESRAAHVQRKEKYGELGDERDEDDTGATQRYYERRNGNQDEREDEEDRMCNTTPRTEEEAMAMVQENAKRNGNTPTEELKQLRRTRVEETILKR